MMRILVLNDFAHVNGGASQVALSSALGLAQAGHDVTLFTAVGPIAPELQNQQNMRVFCTGQDEILADPNRWRAFTTGWWNHTTAEQFRTLLGEYDPANTIIHLHGWTKALSSSVVRTALDQSFSLVCSLHDYFSACPNGAFFNYPEQRICQLRALSPECWLSRCDSRSYPQKLWRCVRGVIQQKAGGLPSRIPAFITVSSLSETILREYLPAKGRIFRVNNPIDIGPAEPVRVAQNDEFQVVGRLSPEKGGLLLTGFNSPRLVFVGDGPLREKIQAALPSAQITGWLAHPQVLERLRKARALIFPSLLYETQGLAVLEAAALGVPAVVPDTCAAREWVEDGVTGLWFRGGDKDDLLRKIELLNDPIFASKLGEAAFNQYWKAPQDMQNHIRGLTGVYESMLKFRQASQ